MTVLLTFARWLGLRGAVALLALAWGGWWYVVAADRADALALSEANVAVLSAQRDAAQQLAIEYKARADRARVDLAAAEKARKAAESARARKWAGIRESEKAWSETPVPESVVEGLR